MKISDNSDNTKIVSLTKSSWLWGEIPIEKKISENSDKGIPYLIENSAEDAGKKIFEIAKEIEKKIK